MSKVFIADIPSAFQEGGLKHLLMEEMTAGDKDKGMLLFFLTSPRESNGFDNWYESRSILDNVVREVYGVSPQDWKEYEGPRFW